MRRTAFDVVTKALAMSEAKCREVVKARSEGVCEICPKRAAQMHHRRNRSQGGQWTPANIMHICLEDHDWIGKNIAAALRNGWTIQGTVAVPSTEPVRRRGELVLLDDLGGYELVRNVMCDNGKSPDEGVEWKDPAQRELPGDGRLTVERESTR